MNPNVIEQDGNLICRRHKKKIIQLIIQDKSIPFSETFLCSKCMDEKPTISKVIGLAQAKAMISERYTNLDCQKEAYKQQTLKDLQVFSQKMMDARSQFIQKIDEILRINQQWITELQNKGKKTEKINLLQELEQMYLNNISKPNEIEILEKTKKAYLTKFDLAFQRLLSFNEFQKCSDCLKNIDLNDENQKQVKNNRIKIIQTDSYEVDTQKPITCELIHSVKDTDYSYSIAFNISGSIMVANCGDDISIWKFYKGRIVEQQRIKVGSGPVFFIVFSKKLNWFASGDLAIRCWKEQVNHDWISSEPQQHERILTYLILNCNEDELISSSEDGTIRVWKVNCQLNQLQFQYTLENKHSYYVYCMSLNQSETALVSFGGGNYTQIIILWMKGQNYKCEYKNQINCEPIGCCRICFISDKQILWQPRYECYTHIIEIVNRNLIDKPELKIQLNQQRDDPGLFPAVFNKMKQIIISKYGQYVYIIRKQNNGQFKIVSDPIDCDSYQSVGALTHDGEYLVIWNDDKKEFRIYRISQ